MEPPKHLIKKVPRGPGSPPVPILHSPPRKLTVEDKQAWKVPPCISNWKNARGYTIPLDKRLAADGRGLQEVTINNKFATLSESLYVAERKASEDLRIRNQIRKKMAMREKEDREKDLRDMASRARMERAGVVGDDEVENDNDFGMAEAKERQAALASRGSGSEQQRDEREDDSRRSSKGNDYDNSRAVTMKKAEVELTVGVTKTRIARTATQVHGTIGLTEMIGMIGTIEIRKKVPLKGRHRMRGWHANNERG